jgi:glucose-6-phosphate-specific signal transduction histidine kinase
MMNKYKSLGYVFWGICVFKKGPEDVPRFHSLTRLFFLIYVTAGAVVFMSSNEFDMAVLLSVMEAATLAGFVFVLLNFFSVPNRFAQVITALYGSGAIMTLLSAPLVYLIDASVRQEESADMARLLLLFVVLWSYTIMGYILHKGTEKPVGVSMLITFCYLYLSFQLLRMMFPETV